MSAPASSLLDPAAPRAGFDPAAESSGWLDPLAAALLRHVDPRHPDTDVPGLRLYRQPTPTPMSDAVYELSLTVVVAGSKRTVIGESDVVWSAGRHLVTPVELPVVSQVLTATPADPFLVLMLRLDRAVIADVLAETGHLPTEPDPQDPTGLVDPGLGAALIRLVELLDTPGDIRVLAPLVHREIVYRLLTGDRADRVRAAVGAGGAGSPVARAARWLRGHPTEALVVADLARRVGIGPSTLHHQFKTLTGMSPGQYQKKLRLAQARRLMAVQGRTASEAAGAVGYASAAHFSRDYRRLYGVPPGQDARRLRQVPDNA